MYKRIVFCLFTIIICSEVHARKDPSALLKLNWIEVKSKNFTVISEGKESKVREFLADLERLKLATHIVLGLKPKEDVSPLLIYAFDKPSTYKAFVKDYTIAGYFSQRLLESIAVVGLAQYKSTDKNNFPRQILFHEYVHYITKSSHIIQEQPHWHQEGFAEYLSTAILRDEFVVIGNPNKFRAYSLDFSYEYDELLTLNSSPHGLLEGAKFYAHSWALVHYLESDKARKNQMIEYLNLVHKGQKEESALAESFGLNFDELRHRVNMYVQKNKFPAKKIHFSPEAGFSKDVVTSVKSLTKSEIATHLGKILVWNSDIDESHEKGIAMLESAVSTDDANSHAHATLALAHYAKDGNSDVIISEIEKAYSLTPDDPVVNAYYGELYVGYGRKMIKDGVEGWQDVIRFARGKFRKAVHKDNTMALAYDGLGDVYLYLEDEPTVDEGIVGYENSYYLIPRPTTLYKLAKLHLKKGNNDFGKQYLRRALRDTRNEKLGTKIKSLLREVDPLFLEVSAE